MQYVIVIDSIQKSVDISCITSVLITIIIIIIISVLEPVFLYREIPQKSTECSFKASLKLLERDIVPIAIQVIILKCLIPELIIILVLKTEIDQSEPQKTVLIMTPLHKVPSGPETRTGTRT